MSDGFLGFKGLGWAAAGLLAVAVVMPASSNSQWDALRTRERTAKSETLRTSELQRPSLLKRLLRTVTGTTDGGTTTGSTTTGTTGGTTTDGTTTGATGVTTTGTTGGTSTGATTGTGTTGTTTNTTTTFNYPELSIVPSNFNVSSEILASGQAGTAAPDNMGAFRFICGPGQILADDPIMYPGQPGKSHLHQFYGNTAADANSTYTSLRTSGQSTCMSPLNRSAYWMPALLDGKGNVLRPDYVAIYYKRIPASDPKCSLSSGDPQALGNCIPLPNGLRFIFGRDMTNLAAPPTGNYNFLCQTPAGGVIGAPSTDMNAILSMCPAGDQFAAGLSSPMCWDGKNLDSANHRSHVSYPSYGSWGYLKCDATHPYVIPQFSMGARWTIMPGDDTSKWIFSSDVAMNQPRGTTFHGDWFGAWDNTVMSTWTNNCINKLLSCSGGNLGNGTIMRMYSGFSWTANPRLVPIPG